jgi:hypothetical protein
LQSIVETLALGAQVFRAAPLAQRFEYGLHGGGAFGGEVAADHARAAEGGADLQVAVVEAVVVGVGVLGAPLLERVGGDRGQVVQRGPGGGGVGEDLVGGGAQFGGQVPGPLDDLIGPGLGDRPGGQAVA